MRNVFNHEIQFYSQHLVFCHGFKIVKYKCLLYFCRPELTKLCLMWILQNSWNKMKRSNEWKNKVEKLVDENK